MRGPVITVDVSKGSCHYQPYLEKGKPFRKPKVLHDTIEGFADLEAIIQKVKEKSREDTVPVVFEATGVYHRCLQKRKICLSLFQRRIIQSFMLRVSKMLKQKSFLSLQTLHCL